MFGPSACSIGHRQRVCDFVWTDFDLSSPLLLLDARQSVVVHLLDDRVDSAATFAFLLHLLSKLNQVLFAGNRDDATTAGTQYTTDFSNRSPPKQRDHTVYARVRDWQSAICVCQDPCGSRPILPARVAASLIAGLERSMPQKSVARSRKSAGPNEPSPQPRSKIRICGQASGTVSYTHLTLPTTPYV